MAFPAPGAAITVTGTVCNVVICAAVNGTTASCWTCGSMLDEPIPASPGCVNCGASIFMRVTSKPMCVTLSILKMGGGAAEPAPSFRMEQEDKPCGCLTRTTWRREPVELFTEHIAATPVQSPHRESNRKPLGSAKRAVPQLLVQ